MDSIIKDVLIYDGTGGPPKPGSVGITAGRITQIGQRIQSGSARIVEGRGRALAPGFIDMHSHSDDSYVVNPKADGKIRQGVTTEVIGNCGDSAAPLRGAILGESQEMMQRVYGVRVIWSSMAEYFQHIEGLGLGANCVALAGHGNLRNIVIGRTDRRASRSESQRMLELLDEALEDGAWGISTGLIYVPSVFGDTAEIVELARHARRRGGFYASHIRGEGDTLEAAVQEAIDIGSGSGALIEVSHHKASGQGNWGKVRGTLQMMDDARARGIRVFTDQYPYVASSTGLDALLPIWAVEGGRQQMIQRLRTPEIRERLRVALQENPYGNWSRVMIANVKHKQGGNARFVGKNLEQLAGMTGKAAEDAAMDLLIEEDGAVAAIFFSMCDDDVERVMTYPHTVIGSDAMARDTYSALSVGQPHPRTFGTFPRVLGLYSREKALLPLEEAIHRMTGMTAARMGLKDRGFIRTGAWADLVLFNPETVTDRATFEQPYQYPEGIDWVFVNGVPVVQEGEPSGELPGKVLRLGRDGRVPPQMG